MRFKDSSVKPVDLDPALLIALFIADGVYKNFGQDLVVTSLNDGKHGENSFHYKGQGADLRTRYFDKSVVPAVAQQIRGRLSDDYDVVVESDHIHLEYDPK